MKLCNYCSGSGEDYEPGKRCRFCLGTGVADAAMQDKEKRADEWYERWKQETENGFSKETHEADDRREEAK